MSALPFVYVNMAMTADGKITSAAREYPRFTSDHDRLLMDRLRAEADAIVVGAGTIRADDPDLRLRSEEAVAYRLSLNKSARMSHVVVSRSLDLPADGGFFTRPGDHRRVVATCAKAPAEQRAKLPDDVSVWDLGDERVDISRLLRRLADEGAERVLLEGGAELNWLFLADSLIDEVYLTIAPALLGGEHAPSSIGGAGFPMAEQTRLTLLSVEQVGDEIYCRYSVRR